MPSACPRCDGTVAATARRCPHCDADLAGRSRDGSSRVQLSTPRPTDLPAYRPPPPGPTGAQRAAEGLVEGTRTGVKVGTRLFRRLSRRGKIIVLAVVVALVVGVPATLWVVGEVAYAPDEPVAAVVDAFNDGDLARAAELAGCSSRLCAPAALAAGYTAPRRMTIANVAMGGSTSPDTADVRIAYTLGAERRQSVVRVRRASGVLPSGYRIVSGLTGTMEVVAPGLSAVTVGGAEVPVDARSGRSAPGEVLIGVYTIGPGPGSRLYEAAGVPAPITGAGVTSVSLAPTVRPALVDNARRQIREFLEACARSPDYEPKVGERECPFRHTWPLPDRSTPAAWTLNPFPEYELAVPAEPTREPQLVVRTTRPGTATVTYTSLREPKRYEYEVKVGGTVTVNADDSVTWTPG